MRASFCDVGSRRNSGAFPIYVTPEASLRYWSAMSQVDSVLFSVAEEIVKSGSVVWDVGANVGLFSCCAAAMSGRGGFVLAMSPISGLHICSAVLLNDWRRANMKVQILKSCAPQSSDSNRISKLAIAQRARSSNHLIEAVGSTEAKGARSLQPTVSLTLDFLLEHFPSPSVLKIDAETHEINILKGAKRLLKEARPRFGAKFHRKTPAKLPSFCIKRNMNSTEHRLPRILTLNEPGSTPLQFQRLPSDRPFALKRLVRGVVWQPPVAASSLPQV